MSNEKLEPEAIQFSGPSPLLSDRMYNILKWLVVIVLPAFGSLYFGLSQIWGLPKAEEVVGTVTLLATFNGVILGISTRSYENSPQKYDGAMIISTTGDGKKNYSLNLESDPYDLDTKKEILFRVLPKPE